MTGPEVDARLTELAPWRESDENAEAAMRNLEEWGAALKAQREGQAAQEGAPAQDAEMLLSEGQRKALCAHANRAGAGTSEDRAALWGYILNTGKLTGTKTLAEEHAQVLLDTLSAWSNEDAVRALTEARQMFFPDPTSTDTEGLPF